MHVMHACKKMHVFSENPLNRISAGFERPLYNNTRQYIRVRVQYAGESNFRVMASRETVSTRGETDRQIDR